MIALASVQTPADASLSWGYAAAAVVTGLLWVLFLVGLPAYFDSDFHRRGVARRRAYRNRQKGTR